jgi:hypothetical protein
MRKPIIAIKLRPNNYAGLINLGNRVFASMTGNLDFPTPAVPLSSVQTAITAAVNAYALWAPVGAHGSKADLLDLRQKSLTLAQLLKSEAQYVQLTAQVASGADYVAMASMITGSGYELAGVPTPQGVLEMVQGFHRFVSRQLAVNKVKFKWAKPNNVTSAGNVKEYAIMRGTTSVFAAAVQIASSTVTSFVDTNTTAAPQTWTYWVVPFNTAGAGVPSDALTVTVLNV